MDKNICEEIRLIDNILQAEDFIRLRIQAGFVEIPVDHARKALQNGWCYVLVSSGNNHFAPISAKRNWYDDC